MTFPSRVISITEAQLLVGLQSTQRIDAEQRWRDACCAFLGAVFNHAPPYLLRQLSDEIFVQRSRMLGQVPIGNPTGDRRPSR